MLAQAVGLPEIFVVLAYLLVIFYLGWLGYMQTRTATDYMIAGRKIHPFVMAVSYGATFISTSAIVGFGGVAGMFGMSLLWLTFLNIFVGIFIAFVFLGGPTRKMGHRLDAHTFPELIGRRYNSKFIQIFAGLIIFIGMPLYASAVLIGACEFIAARFGIDYSVALLIFSLIIAAYVVMGGLKGVMYADALQGSIMFVGMLILLVATYVSLGGITESHTALTEMKSLPSLFGKMGFKGWTSMPQFGWGDNKYDLWWIVVSTITLGVGIGVLAQPQLAVRFMTVKSKRELNRAVLIGGIFILIMTGVAFTVGALSNLYFYKYEKITGKIVNTTEKTGVIAKKERGVEVRVPCALIHIDTNGDDVADITVVKNGYDVEKDGIVVAPFSKLMPAAEITQLENGNVEVRPQSTAFLRAVTKTGAGDWMFNTDSIIPTYITSALPKWFGLLFLLTLLSAAMSTLSSQFHALGTSIGRDVFEQITGKYNLSTNITRTGIVLGIVLAVIFSHTARGGYIVARATAIFFGLCASAFLPAFIGGLFFKWVTKAAVICSMIVGAGVTLFWLVFVKSAEAGAIGIVQKVTEGKASILLDKPNWPVVDPLIVALPISLLVAIVVSLFTKRPSDSHMVKCFGDKA
ncbi:MAG: sodium:solute symporter family protein [Phycisphaerae bacterium]|jgi:SSS family solute:Na+ symporter